MNRTLIPNELTTPAVLVERAVLVRNVAAMAAAMAAMRIDLRPHVKTHKIPEIAALQLEAGAVGLTVATIGEAETFADAGCDDVFIAYPLWLTAATASRLDALARRCRLSFGVDSPEAARNAGALLGRATRAAVEMLIEVDSGHHRSGATADSLVGIAEAVTGSGLRLGGVFTFPGHSYTPGGAGPAAADEAAALVGAARILEDAGFDVPRRSGGSTPSALLADRNGLTEARPGVYVFGDAQQLELERIGVDGIALCVAGTVVSRHESEPRRVILDSGSKILGGDRPAWATGFGRLLDHPEARITALSEHHATVTWPDGARLPELGARLRVVPNHVCLVLNLVDDVWVCDEGAVVDRWSVAARGRNY
jgi:D-serine deaminase-like pyridoxal phosphate-dependent protein